MPTSLPTQVQQRAIAYTPKPFAALSLLASLYVFRHLIEHPKKRCKMYHRVVGHMNISIFVQGICMLWGNWVISLSFRHPSVMILSVSRHHTFDLELTEFNLFCLRRHYEHGQAVPDGTHFAGAAGTVQTCTVQGFFSKATWKIRLCLTRKMNADFVCCRD